MSAIQPSPRGPGDGRAPRPARLLGCLGLLLLAPRTAAQGDLESLRLEARAEACEAPAKEELERAERLFALALSGKADPAALDALAAELRFEVLRLDVSGAKVIVLREAAGHRKGRGMYAFRGAGAGPVAIQAPHSDDDLHTGALAAMLFAEGRAAAAAWSTAPRRAAVEGRAEPADLAHLDESFFQAFTRAFAAAHPKGICLQLHGFARDLRKTEAGASADAILSDGDERPSPWVDAAARCLEGAGPGSAAVYPRDVRELGGTGNVQGKALRRLGHEGFVHLEMSLELRRRLKESAAGRKALLGCLPEGQP